jgi:hypothetical protein
MAHFARIDSNNVVQEVLAVRNEDCGGGNDETAGQAFLAASGFEGTWKQTSYNTTFGVHYTKTPESTIADGKPQFRGNYASVGMIYDEEHDAFIHPKPLDTAVLNTTTYMWEIPTE